MPKVKICGLKTLEDVKIVNKNLPEYVGFVFAASKRQVSDEQAKMMKEQLDKRIQAVGVFVNEPQEHIISLYKQGIIDIVQLHGDEDNKYIEELKCKINATVIKAIKVQTSELIKKELQSNADFFLFDTYRKGTYGGNGERFELTILIQILQEENIKKPFFIAGGLTSENVDDVLNKIECYGVDVSSGVETDNKKDSIKVQQFIERVRKDRLQWKRKKDVLDYMEGSTYRRL